MSGPLPVTTGLQLSASTRLLLLLQLLLEVGIVEPKILHFVLQLVDVSHVGRDLALQCRLKAVRWPHRVIIPL